MATQVIQKVKGTRDFYPRDMAFRKWLYAQIQAVSERYGYQEYDGPEIERLELYTEKTSEEIVRTQAFTMRDRDNRELALRPELTPTLARMVANAAGALTLPLRWYSFGRCWRYEQPQRGRGREFFQWEIDIMGPETPQADAEILAIAADFLRTIGLTSDEVVIRVNDRSFLEDQLHQLNIPTRLTMPILRVIDRKEKITDTEFVAALAEVGLTKSQISQLAGFLASADYSASGWLTRMFAALKAYPGASEYVRFDPIIVRGFDYYTGVVFEAWDKTGGLRRALFGGGRFDNLTSTLGGRRIPGIGMAPGDMPIEELLRQFGKLPPLTPPVASVLVTAVIGQADTSLRLANELRQAGITTELWLDSGTKLDKQLGYADKKGIPVVALMGAENTITLKQLATSRQITIPCSEAVRQVQELLT